MSVRKEIDEVIDGVSVNVDYDDNSGYFSVYAYEGDDRFGRDDLDYRATEPELRAAKLGVVAEVKAYRARASAADAALAKFYAAIKLQSDTQIALDQCDDMVRFAELFNSARAQLDAAVVALQDAAVPRVEWAETRAAAYRLLRDCEILELRRRMMREANEAVESFVRDARGLMTAAIQAATEVT